MTPQSFEFRLSMPGDARLLGAVRDLTTHAATYAQLPPDASRGLVDQVAGATEEMIASLNGNDAPIDYHYAADGATVTVTISWHTPGGTRETRTIQQRVSS